MKKVTLLLIMGIFLTGPLNANASVITDFIQWIIPSQLKQTEVLVEEREVKEGVEITAKPSVLAGDTTETYYLPALGSRIFTINNYGPVDLYLNKSNLLRYSASPSVSPGDVPLAYALNVGVERDITIYNPSTTTNYFLGKNDLGVVNSGSVAPTTVFLSEVEAKVSLADAQTSQSIASFTFGFTFNNATNKDVYISRLIDKNHFISLSPLFGAATSIKFIETIPRVSEGDVASAYVIPAGTNRKFEVTGIVDNTKGSPGTKTLSISDIYYSHSAHLTSPQTVSRSNLRQLSVVIKMDEVKLQKAEAATSTATSTPPKPPVVIPPVIATSTVLASTTPPQVEPAFVIVSASTTSGSPLIDAGETVGYPVTFTFTVRADGKAAYVSKNPITTLVTTQTGFGGGAPTFTTITASPGIRGDGGSYFIIPQGATRTFKALAILRNDGITVPGTQTVTVSKINYGWTSALLSENSTSQNITPLKASVRLAPPRVKSTPSQTPTPSPTATESAQSTPAQTPTELIALCYAVPTVPETGETVTWHVMQTGGSGTVSYNWAGTDELKGSLANVKKTYSTTGRKNALVAVTAGTKTISASCYVNVVAAPVTATPSETPSNTATPSETATGSPTESPSDMSSRELLNRGLVASAFYALGEFLDSLISR